jgi:murein tripeptide amidase MpaA
MQKRSLILIIVSVLSAFNCYSQLVNSDDRLRRIIDQDGQVEVVLHFTDKKTLESLTINTSILSVSGNSVNISLSPLTFEWFIRQKFQYQIVEEVAAKTVTTALKSEQLKDWDVYPTYTQYDSVMQVFAKKYPSLCHLDTIGTSVNGKLVLALRISGSGGVKPAVFYTSTIHGDETGGFILMLHLADYLVKNYQSDQRVTKLLDNLEVWINPLANPDGTYRSGNTIDSPTRYNANGYDLNRNFPDPITPGTLKQKETLDMIKFMSKHKFVLSANFHSGSEVVNYPWDRWLSKLHADDSWFYSISRGYADTAHVYAGPEYMNFLDNGVTRGAMWYIVYGGRQDYMTGDLHGREVTIEIDDQYVTPAAQLPLLWQNNWHSLLGYLENALYGIHGLVRNADTQVPVPARVFIRGHDIDSSQVYSDTTTGSFVRFLVPGSWNLTFSAVGYRDTTVNNVIVTSAQKTELLVEMSPLADKVETPDSGKPPLLYPNPAKDVLNAILPDTMAGNVRVCIINYMGIVVSDFYAQPVDNLITSIDLNSLPAGLYIAIFTNAGTKASFKGRFVIVK